MVNTTLIPFIIIGLIVVNFLGFLLMGIDKGRAIKQNHRIPESVLWLIAILGGGVGSFAGMTLFRHKTKRISFMLGIPLIIIIHLGLVVYIKLS